MGELLEFGRRVQAEARRRGLGNVARVYVVADGGVWIWNIVTDRFAEATGVLDFYHASQLLWAVAHTLYPAGGGQRGDGIIVRATARPFQTVRTVLDGSRTATTDGAGSGPPQPGRG